LDNIDETLRSARLCGYLYIRKVLTEQPPLVYFTSASASI